MPLNVRRFYSSIFLAPLVFFSLSYAQTTTASSSPQQVNEPQTAAQPAPTSGDVMRDRIMKSKAYIAVRNYNAAIYELENIRKETTDSAVRSVTNVLLMNSYLELGDYKRAQAFLNQFYNEQKTTKPDGLAAYSAIAGQVVAGARNRAERYKALGLDLTNRLLPLEALNDLQNMRELLELVVTQSKEISQTPAKARDGMAIMEEATASRAMLARDEYDAKNWRDMVGDTREAMATGNAKILNAMPKDSVSGELVASNAQQNTQPQTSTSQPSGTIQPPASQGPAPQPANDTDPNARARTVADPNANQTASAKTDAPVYVPASTTSQADNKLVQKTVMSQPVNQPPAQSQVSQPKPQETAKKDDAKTDKPAATEPASNSPVDLGSSLIAYATAKPQPVISPTARAMRTTGIVRVDVTIDEKGDVVDVQKVSGPGLLQAAAKDAIKKWKFKPYTRDGQPVKVSGFVNFNFTM